MAAEGEEKKDEETVAVDKSVEKEKEIWEREVENLV